MTDTIAILQKALVEQAARAAALEAGADANLLAAFIAARTSVSIDGESVKLFVNDEAGNPMIANARGDRMTPSLFAASLKTDAKYAAAYPGPASGEKSGTKSAQVITRAAFDAMNPAERHHAIARGTKVTD